MYVMGIIGFYFSATVEKITALRWAACGHGPPQHQPAAINELQMPEHVQMAVQDPPDDDAACIHGVENDVGAEGEAVHIELFGNYLPSDLRIFTQQLELPDEFVMVERCLFDTELQRSVFRQRLDIGDGQRMQLNPLHTGQQRGSWRARTWPSTSPRSAVWFRLEGSC